VGSFHGRKSCHSAEEKRGSERKRVGKLEKDQEISVFEECKWENERRRRARGKEEEEREREKDERVEATSLFSEREEGRGRALSFLVDGRPGEE